MDGLEFMQQMKNKLNQFNSWQLPILINGKEITEIEIQKDAIKGWIINIKS